MKRNLIFFPLLFILILLDGAALHDILYKEPDITAEIIVLLLSIPVLAGLVYYKLNINRHLKSK